MNYDLQIQPVPVTVNGVIVHLTAQAKSGYTTRNGNIPNCLSLKYKVLLEKIK